MSKTENQIIEDMMRGFTAAILAADVTIEEKQFMALKAVGHLLGTTVAIMKQANPALASASISAVAGGVMNEIIPLLDSIYNRQMN